MWQCYPHQEEPHSSKMTKKLCALSVPFVAEVDGLEAYGAETDGLEAGRVGRAQVVVECNVPKAVVWSSQATRRRSRLKVTLMSMQVLVAQLEACQSSVLA